MMLDSSSPMFSSQSPLAIPFDKNKNQSPLAFTKIASKVPVPLKRKQGDLHKDEQTKAVKHF